MYWTSHWEGDIFAFMCLYMHAFIFKALFNPIMLLGI